jgi:DNA-binding transcriptional ArsR family regulator
MAATASVKDLRCCLSPALFRALSDPTRLAILVALASRSGERTVSELGLCCPVDLSVVSRHLRTLREAGVVEARKDGREVRYRVRFGALVAELRALADAIEACCPSGEGAAPPRRARGAVGLPATRGAR